MRRLSCSIAAPSVTGAASISAAGADPLGEMLWPDGLSIPGQRRRALDLVLELPHVAGERIVS
jgi:hypothetical protein